jgi:hypothetical protein
MQAPSLQGFNLALSILQPVIVAFSGILGLKRESEPPSPTNYSNFVHEQNDYGRQRDPDGQRVASEEVQGHACPAEASSY